MLRFVKVSSNNKKNINILPCSKVGLPPELGFVCSPKTELNPCMQPVPFYFYGA